MIEVRTRVEFMAYLKLMYELTYRKKVNIFLGIVGVLLITIAVIKPAPFNFEFFLGCFFILFIPLLTFWGSRKSFQVSPILNSEVIYTFSPDRIKISIGEMKSELLKKELSNIEETKDFFLLQLNKANLYPIPKKDISEQEREKIRHLLF
ncbi:YcxB family protein [Siphonobacter sp. SORGH_AS_1065]|uniref:YcxB family protein n=1 Tax=Siphonobacter sp. SORGH_AS_1065 TaxID=3041795 RepID=UPI0027861A25|nr:YcxB family protein [Siphonobacter sp. SORGH_AS_1065]MDQ1088058.1 hypothetical protein [Siphonobacter sp. SORGH_AS_1065]